MLSEFVSGIMLPIGSLEEMLGTMIPIIALMIPIVVIMSRHQMRMAALIHGRSIDQNDNIVQTVNPQGQMQLAEEVRQLRELMHQQAIALDNLRDEVRGSISVQDRINQNS